MATQTEDEKTTVGAEEFRDRLEQVYVELGSPRQRRGYPPEDGAQRWFAEIARTTTKTVGRWATGVHPVPGPAVALLERIESEAEERSGSVAEEVREENEHLRRLVSELEAELDRDGAGGKAPEEIIAERNRAIRALLSAGYTLREAAATVGLSKTRIGQIKQEAAS